MIRTALAIVGGLVRTPWGMAVAGLLAAAALAWATHSVYAWRGDYAAAQVKTATDALKGEHAATLGRISAMASAAAEKARAAEAAWSTAAAAIDNTRTKEKTDALEENRRLAARVAAGDLRLRVAARCPAAGGGDVPAPAGAARLGDAGALAGGGAAGRAVLDPAAERDALELRAGLIADRSALRALQDYVRQVCPGPSQITQGN